MTTLFSVIGKAALGLALVVSLSGSAQGQELAPAANGAFAGASWLVTYHWDGSTPHSTIFTFTQTNPKGGTFVTQDGYNGRYLQRPGDPRAVLAYQNVSPPWTTVYSLTVAPGGRTFSGVMGRTDTSGVPVGTHTAIRVRSVKDPGELRNLLLEETPEVTSSGEAAKGVQSK